MRKEEIPNGFLGLWSLPWNRF